MALETLLATIVIPAVVDLFKSGASAAGRKWIGLSVDDQIKLQTADISKLEALAKIDNPYGTPSQWVIDLRASFRYVAAGVLVIGGLGLAAYGASTNQTPLIQTGLETAGTPFLFIFGERMWNGFKK